MDGEQGKLWNGTAGAGWARMQGALDQMYAPFAELLVEEAETLGPRDILDIGCGAGATTRALCGVGGRDCLGVDFSQPLIDLATKLAAAEDNPARFVCADAASHAFAAGAFDLAVSRFGASFFADPVAAFSHLRGALGPGGALRLLTWRPASQTDFMTAAERAAASFLPEPPPRPADAPGPFALADEARAASILAQSGWRNISVTAVDRVCAFPARDLADYFAWMGPVGRVLQKADAGTRARILDLVQPAFAPFVQGGEVRFAAACWLIAAQT